MKKMTLLLAGAAAATWLLAGCTTVETTSKFNNISLYTGNNEKAIAHIHARITGIYIFGLPFVVGSAAGDGKCAFFMNTQKDEHVVNLLTREAKSKGASRLANLNTSYSEDFIFANMISKRTFQGDGIAVQTKQDAVAFAAQEFEKAP